MRLKRWQAIRWHQYKNDKDAFEKFYQTPGIDNYRGDLSPHALEENQNQTVSD